MVLGRGDGGVVGGVRGGEGSPISREEGHARGPGSSTREVVLGEGREVGGAGWGGGHGEREGCVGQGRLGGREGWEGGPSWWESSEAGEEDGEAGRGAGQGVAGPDGEGLEVERRRMHRSAGLPGCP